MLQFCTIMIKLFDTTERFKRKYWHLLKKINDLEPTVKLLKDEDFPNKTAEYKERILNGEGLESLLPEAFALVREASIRILGQRHFDVQLLGGIALFYGKISEMKTGEGKTLVSTLPAYLEALSGKGVHIVTVNEYLVKRDSEWMGSIHKFLGLSVGYIANDMEPKDRIVEYRKDITYGTNSEFGFDYLRDNMVHSASDRVQRELNYAVVDEVDSILVDEARTPLIISGPAEKSTDLYYKAARAIRFLVKEEDFTVDEKTKSVTIVEKGAQKLQGILHIPDIYGKDQIDLLRHLNQALRAKNCFENEVDYIVKDGEVIIVDEFTGRLLQGRRYSDGLHQAIEAKENLKVKDENQTLATITFQNYFRMYSKLSGMTGTAKTEENEFREIYGLDVIVIPTNKEVVRKDFSDVIYKTEAIKFKMIAQEIVECHKNGQPVLVGTRSIEKSERLSKILTKLGITHEVLNAKYHEKEAEIIKKAGEKAAVTIATNMAGRGVDIVLGNRVQDLGGLHVIGTERHESRRIDNQLRGRSGRQGDPGSTRFYLSLEDELLRIFGGERITKIFDTLKIDEEMPLENMLLTRAIENAQKKVEAYNFDIRKSLIEYDNVLNKQRDIIYNERKRVLESIDIQEHVNDMMMEIAEGLSHKVVTADIKSENQYEILNHNIFEITGTYPNFKDLDRVKDLTPVIYDYLQTVYQKKEKMVGFDGMRNIEQQILIYIVDNKWKDHLYGMDHLKEGIGLRGYGQQDPLMVYQKEGFQMFEDMLGSIKEEVVQLLFKIQINPMVARPQSKEDQSAEGKAEKGSGERTKNKKVELASNNKSMKIGRNDPCPCGSGKKYKKCCGSGEASG
jgi:preprotein translocase subunit SecA